MGLPTMKTLICSELPRVLMALFMSLTGLFSVSAVNEYGHCSVFVGDGSANQRPSNFDGLDSEFYDILSVMRRKIEEEYGFNPSVVTDRHSARSYFTADPVNRHLDGTYLCPFNFVEPSGLLVETKEAVAVATHGQAVKMPLVKNRGVYFNPGCFEVEGRVVSGASLYVVKEKGNLRHDAMSYLLSAGYNPANGLGQVEYAKRADLGTATTDAMFVKEGETNGAARRWITPHNPMPNVNEAYSTLPLSFSYMYRGRGREPSKDDWSSGEYTSMLGHFRVDTSKRAGTKATSRDVPEHIKYFVENTNKQLPLMDMGRLMQYLPGVEPRKEEDVVESPPEPDPDDGGDITSPDMELPTEEPDGEGEEAGVEASPDIGVRPVPPDV